MIAINLVNRLRFCYENCLEFFMKTWNYRKFNLRESFEFFCFTETSAVQSHETTLLV